MTIIQDLGIYQNNHLWMKREDLIPFSFGGNKARKAQLFFKEIDECGYNAVVTYGSGSSNHCRVIANLCRQRGIDCHIISPLEASEETYNSALIELLGARVTTVPVSIVHETIEKKLIELRKLGEKPYFIEGGGHGNIGTEAYVQCYQEIRKQERELSTFFDYIFFATGTGTTQAGLVCGQLINGDRRTIIGISIARKNPYGREVVLNSIREYLGDRASEAQIQEATNFVDDYTGGGYGKDMPAISLTIDEAFMQYGIPLDMTYTGKAFMGMREYIKANKLTAQNILFIHTGGTPLFFDRLRKGKSV